VLGLLYKVDADPEPVCQRGARLRDADPERSVLFGRRRRFQFQFAAGHQHPPGSRRQGRGSNTRVDAALFQVKTQDELVVDVSSGGRTSYRNASATCARAENCRSTPISAPAGARSWP
jgi:iron complex outermembrane receptor protein